MDLDRLAKLAKVVGAVAVPVLVALGGVEYGEGVGLERHRARRDAIREQRDGTAEALVLLAAAYDREKGCADDLIVCRQNCAVAHEDFPAPPAPAAPVPDVGAGPPPNIPARIAEKLPASAQSVLGVAP